MKRKGSCAVLRCGELTVLAVLTAGWWMCAGTRADGGRQRVRQSGGAGDESLNITMLQEFNGVQFYSQSSQ